MNKNNLNVKLLSCEICGKQSESRNYNVVSCPGTLAFCAYFLQLYSIRLRLTDLSKGHFHFENIVQV